MPTRPNDIVEFYEQLALLVRARLPLPEGLRQLSRELTSPELRGAIARMGESTARGSTLSEALAFHPSLFHPFHRRLIASAEHTGALAETLGSPFRNYQCSYIDVFADGDELHLFVPHRWRQVLHLQFNERALDAFPTQADLCSVGT